MLIDRYTVPIVCDAAGAATVYSPVISGRILGIRIVVGTLANTADLTITAEATGEAIVTITNLAATGSYYPRAQVHDTAGAGATFNGTQKVLEPVAIGTDRVKIVVAQGGNGGTATVYLLVG